MNKQVLNKVYVIISHWGQYDMSTNYVEGFVTSELNAKQLVKEIDEYYSTPHPLIPADALEEDYYNIINEFSYVIYKWEDIEQKMYQDLTQEYDLTNIRDTQKDKYKKVMSDFDSRMKIERVKWFSENENIQHMLPKDKNWNDILNQYDIWRKSHDNDYTGTNYELIEKINSVNDINN